MIRKRRKRSTIPVMLLWSKRENQRFCEAVERLQSLVNDLERVLAPRKRKLAAQEQPNGQTAAN